jgi:hypothetical protein
MLFFVVELMNHADLLLFGTDDDPMIVPLSDVQSSTTAEADDGDTDVDSQKSSSVTLVASTAHCHLQLPDVALLTDCATMSSSSPPGSPRHTDKESTPLLHGGDASHDGFAVYNSFPDDQEYTNVLYEAEQAIDHGIYPERISQGSSGSYFVKNREGVRSFKILFIYNDFA